jgi:hypothetical protein
MEDHSKFRKIWLKWKFRAIFSFLTIIIALAVYRKSISIKENQNRALKANLEAKKWNLPLYDLNRKIRVSRLNFDRRSPGWLSIFLIALSGNVELNPGPNNKSNFQLLSYASWNVNSLLKKDCLVLDELNKSYLIPLDIDVLALQESKLDSQDTD